MGGLLPNYKKGDTMKKRLWLFAFILLILPIVSAEYSKDSANLVVIATSYEPYPAEPGEYLDLWLNLNNYGGQPIEELTFVLKPEYPFYLDGRESSERYFGKILPYQTVLVHYKIRVDENAVEGENALKYEYRYSGHSKWIPNSVDIIIQTIDAILTVDSVMTVPESVAPGETSQVKVKLKNTADSLLKSINIRLGLITEIRTTTSISYTELPFTPIGQSNEMMIYQLGAGEEEEIVFNLVADPDAETKPYKIPMYITYVDELGENYSKTSIVGLIVGTEPEMSFSIESSEIRENVATGNVIIKFINKGLIDIKFLNAKLLPSDDYEIINSNEVYIGNVDSDDYETAEFRLHVKQATTDSKVALPLVLEYRDANNNMYKKEVSVDLILFSAEKLGVAEKKGTTTIILAVIIIVVGYFVYRKWEKKRKKAKK
jgi:hypothetical protein